MRRQPRAPDPTVLTVLTPSLPGSHARCPESAAHQISPSKAADRRPSSPSPQQEKVPSGKVQSCQTCSLLLFLEVDMGSYLCHEASHPH